MTEHKTGDHPDLKMVNPNAAAIDIGSTMHMAAVNPDTASMPARAFGTFTQDLHDLAEWLQSCGVHQRGDGVDRRLLGPRLRDPGGTWLRGHPRECPIREKCAGP